jgi:hypothetical protein
VGSDWKSITKEEFDDFRIDPTYLAQRRNLPTTFGISSISATPSAIPKLSPPTTDVAVVLDPSFGYKTTRLTANRRSANDYQDDFDDRKQDWSLQPDDIFDAHPIAYQTETRFYLMIDPHKISLTLHVSRIERQMATLVTVKSSLSHKISLTLHVLRIESRMATLVTV